MRYGYLKFSFLFHCCYLVYYCCCFVDRVLFCNSECPGILYINYKDFLSTKIPLPLPHAWDLGMLLSPPVSNSPLLKARVDHESHDVTFGEDLRVSSIGMESKQKCFQRSPCWHHQQASPRPGT